MCHTTHEVKVVYRSNHQTILMLDTRVFRTEVQAPPAVVTVPQAFDLNTMYVPAGSSSRDGDVGFLFVWSKTMSKT